jgi:hypothetical protein
MLGENLHKLRLGSLRLTGTTWPEAVISNTFWYDILQTKYVEDATRLKTSLRPLKGSRMNWESWFWTSCSIRGWVGVMKRTQPCLEARLHSASWHICKLPDGQAFSLYTRMTGRGSTGICVLNLCHVARPNTRKE